MIQQYYFSSVRNRTTIVIQFKRLTHYDNSPSPPKAKVWWFYATEPAVSKTQKELTKESLQKFRGKKWSTFSTYDSQQLENVYLHLAKGKSNVQLLGALNSINDKFDKRFHKMVDPKETSLKSFYRAYKRIQGQGQSLIPLDKVPVNEDNLFEADVQNFTMSSIYWDGPVYGIRRGLWFDDENVPLDTSVTNQIEDGYQYLKPWMFERSGTAHCETAATENENVKDDNKVKTAQLQKANAMKKKEKDYWTINTYCAKYPSNPVKKNVFFVDANHAYLVDDLGSLNKVKLFLLQNLPKGAGIIPGFKYIKRGFDERKAKQERDNQREQEKEKQATVIVGNEKKKSMAKKMEKGISITGLLTRELGGLLSLTDSDKKTSELIGKQLDNDFNNGSSGSSDSSSTTSNQRDVDHLVFCVHGIGQILGAKYENINFIHTVNLLRKNLKRNSEEILGDANSKIQVIPIVWRNLIDFNIEDQHQDLAESARDANKKTGNGGDNKGTDKSILLKENKNALPSLGGITIDEIQPIRNLINNTLLDILLYYEASYKDEILMRVIQEINKAFRKFLIYNPNFNGKVSLIGHSLGSAICFDILSLQKFALNFKINDENSNNKDSIKYYDQKLNNVLNDKLVKSSPFFQNHTLEDCQLDFNVHNYFAIGSPFGLFHLLKKKQLKSRKLLSFIQNKKQLEEIDLSKVALPSCNRFYNVYDLCDPVAYRIEPLINKHYSEKKSAVMNYNELLKRNPSFFDALSGEIINTGRNYLSEYTETGLNIINKQFENLIRSGRSIFDEEEAKKNEKQPQDKSESSSGADVKGAIEQVDESGKRIEALSEIQAEEGEQKAEKIPNSTVARPLSAQGSNDFEPKDNKVDDVEKSGTQKRDTYYNEELNNVDFHYLGGENPNDPNAEELDFNYDEVLNGKPSHMKYNDNFYQIKGTDQQIEQDIDMLSCNANGRVDYSIPQSMYDVLLINTLKSHVTYFENEHISKFLLNEMLFNGEKPDDGIVDDQSKTIVLHKEKE